MNLYDVVILVSCLWKRINGLGVEPSSPGGGDASGLLPFGASSMLDLHLGDADHVHGIRPSRPGRFLPSPGGAGHVHSLLMPSATS